MPDGLDCDDFSYGRHPGGMTEAETLARLTVEEKRAVAEPAILEFPHLSDSMLDEWLRGHGVDVSVSASQEERVEALLDALVAQACAGQDKEALDHFIYGYVEEAALCHQGIDPDEVAEREPLDRWEGVYDLD